MPGNPRGRRGGGHAKAAELQGAAVVVAAVVAAAAVVAGEGTCARPVLSALHRFSSHNSIIRQYEAQA